MVTAADKTSAAAANDALAEADDSIEDIRDAKRLRFLLTRLRDEHTWLNIRTPSLRGKRFRSVVVDVDEKDSSLILDELMPRELPGRPASGLALRILADLDGGQLMFDTTLDRVVTYADAPALCCAMPESLTFRQRRREHRSVVGFGATIPVTLVAEEDAAVHGRLFDISSSGLSVTLEHEPVSIDALERDTTAARIELPNGNELEAPVSVVHVNCDGNETQVRIGGRFGALSPEQQRSIIRFVMECEREAARRHIALKEN